MLGTVGICRVPLVHLPSLHRLGFCGKTPVANPRCAPRRSHRPSTTRPRRPATVHLTGSNQKERAIPGARWARTFRCRFCPACNVYDRLHSRDRQPILPAFSADPGAAWAGVDRVPLDRADGGQPPPRAAGSACGPDRLVVHHGLAARRAHPVRPRAEVLRRHTMGLLQVQPEGRGVCPCDRWNSA